MPWLVGFSLVVGKTYQQYANIFVFTLVASTYIGKTGVTGLLAKAPAQKRPAQGLANTVVALILPLY